MASLVDLSCVNPSHQRSICETLDKSPRSTPMLAVPHGPCPELLMFSYGGSHDSFECGDEKGVSIAAEEVFSVSLNLRPRTQEQYALPHFQFDTRSDGSSLGLVPFKGLHCGVTFRRGALDEVFYELCSSRPHCVFSVNHNKVLSHKHPYRCTASSVEAGREAVKNGLYAYALSVVDAKAPYPSSSILVLL